MSFEREWKIKQQLKNLTTGRTLFCCSEESLLTKRIFDSSRTGTSWVKTYIQLFGRGLLPVSREHFFTIVCYPSQKVGRNLIPLYEARCKSRRTVRDGQIWCYCLYQGHLFSDPLTTISTDETFLLRYSMNSEATRFQSNLDSYFYKQKLKFRTIWE